MTFCSTCTRGLSFENFGHSKNAWRPVALPIFFFIRFFGQCKNAPWLSLVLAHLVRLCSAGMVAEKSGVSGRELSLLISVSATAKRKEEEREREREKFIDNQ